MISPFQNRLRLTASCVNLFCYMPAHQASYVHTMQKTACTATNNLWPSRQRFTKNRQGDKPGKGEEMGTQQKKRTFIVSFR